VLLADNNGEICCQVSTKDTEIFFSTRIIGKKKTPELLRHGSIYLVIKNNNQTKI
jgi:hypothetical protein